MEHVPPRCLFPEEKVFGVNYRKGLIRVSSCDEHNSEKSQTDEILRQILVASPLTNTIGQGLLQGKWKRAFERNPRLFNEFVKGGKPIRYKLEEDEKYQEGMLIKKNLDEMDESFRKICAGLFFYETNERLNGSSSLITGFTPYLNKSVQRANELELEKVRDYFSNKERLGENPEVFYYFRRYTENLKTFYLIFYEHNEVLVRYQ